MESNNTNPLLEKFNVAISIVRNIIGDTPGIAIHENDPYDFGLGDVLTFNLDFPCVPENVRPRVNERMTVRIMPTETGTSDTYRVAVTGFGQGNGRSSDGDRTRHYKILPDGTFNTKKFSRSLQEILDESVRRAENLAAQEERYTLEANERRELRKRVAEFIGDDADPDSEWRLYNQDGVSVSVETVNGAPTIEIQTETDELSFEQFEALWPYLSNTRALADLRQPETASDDADKVEEVESIN